MLTQNDYTTKDMSKKKKKKGKKEDKKKNQSKKRIYTFPQTGEQVEAEDYQSAVKKHN